MIRLLFNSTRQVGRLALDSTDGHTLSSGQYISVKQGEFWIAGVVESDGETYALIPEYGSWQTRIPLQAGMTIQDGTMLTETEIDVSQVKAGDSLYWKSVGAFVEVLNDAHASFYGYTFDVRHVGHVEQARYKHGERVKVQREQEEDKPENLSLLEDMYGPAAKFSEHRKGMHITYRSAEGPRRSGTIVYVQAANEVANQPIRYVVEPDDIESGELPGMPDVVWPADVIIQ